MVSPSRRYSVANLASQRRAAFASIASNTCSSSPRDLLMIFSTSEVAETCSSASSRSWVRQSSCSCRAAVDMRAVGALRTLGPILRWPFTGCRLPRRRCMLPPRIGHAMVAIGCDARKGLQDLRMSALGQKRTYAPQRAIPLYPRKRHQMPHRDVRYGPKADIDDGSLAMVGCCARQSDRADSMERAVATGTVKWFNPTKGYGFIQPQSGGKDVFVHISALERAGLSTLNEGATVDYEIVSDRGKESAGNLKVR